eukprot:Partr_v1_DN25998_c0_g1_i2_m68809 putative acyl-CoA dehydrogenase
MNTNKELKPYSRDEVAKHSTATDFWLIIDGLVYDLTRFAAMHPGGEGILDAFRGRDATVDFYSLHRHQILEKYAPRLLIGRIENEEPMSVRKAGQLSRVPYAEASVWQSRWHSPFYTDSHRRFKVALRLFFDNVVLPEAREFDALGKAPSQELFEKCGEFGLLASRIGPGAHLEGRSLPASIAPADFDYFHELIAHEEMAYLGYPGYTDGLACGMVIGLPPVLHFGKRALIDRVVPEVLSGRKRICLAITEPFAGSDVAGIQATAVKTPDGKHYIVNGVKKWITGGHPSTYFSTAVRTGGKGMAGISMLLIERGPGVETKIIKTSYSSSAGTAYVTFENVKVPVENLLGVENEGFKCIMYNFNHERWLIVCQSVRASRLIVEECFKWAVQRRVFGKPLIAQPVIREKLALMIGQVEAVQSWLENITYQMTKMSYDEAAVSLAGPIALLKVLSTKVGTYVGDEACQIFGGRAITQSGMGEVVERYHRATKFAAILGGSEEIMADLGVKQALRFFPKS